jgi:hypothetical protein
MGTATSRSRTKVVSARAGVCALAPAAVDTATTTAAISRRTVNPRFSQRCMKPSLSLLNPFETSLEKILPCSGGGNLLTRGGSDVGFRR